MPQIPINHTIFWESVMRTFKYIYVNCFSRLRFLAEFRAELQKKCFFFWQFKDYNSWKNSETRQMTSFFSSTFSALFLTFLFVFENSQHLYSWCTPFVPFCSVKYLNFGQKLPIQTAQSILCFIPWGEPKKGISSWTNIMNDVFHLWLRHLCS